MQDIIADFIVWFTLTFSDPPMAALFIVAVSVTITSISQLATRRFTDVKRQKRYQAEVKQYQEMEKAAQKSGNEKLLKKVKRRKAYIDRIQREMMTQRCKPSLMFMVPFLLVYTLMRNFYLDPVTGLDRIVVVLPFNIANVPLLPWAMVGGPVTGGFGMTFFGFYFLVGLGMSGILQRVFGTQIM
jgi:uncharacterized membrane protein (DUF106 family)